jgi:hypothetical protein
MIRDASPNADLTRQRLPNSCAYDIAQYNFINIFDIYSATLDCRPNSDLTDLSR